ncbi:MAG: hypothetical protein OIF51_00015 [Cellvibrionaceae bacterium]|nr:hypothetical protein [Cellvibrionaceae bacterium]
MNGFEDLQIEFIEHDSVAIPLCTEWISELIPNGIPGAYVLYKDEQPIYVGRSDTCLKRRLLSHDYRTLATHATWQIANNPEQAYHYECFWYDWAKEKPGFLNQISPARPKASCTKLELDDLVIHMPNTQNCFLTPYAA